jgi:hypothetical protein
MQEGASFMTTTTSRKAMRVATVFTGAAATAVAFAPVAMAATGQATPHGHPAQAAGTNHTVRPDVHSGSIRSTGCTTNTWLHVQYESVFRTLCKAFGFKGRMTPASSPLVTSAQCGGNNYGVLYYSGNKHITFGPGTTYRTFNPTKNISEVAISRWNGTDKCAWPR